MREFFGRSGRAFLVGVTGAPGAGKSTLVDGLVARWRKSGSTVGVLAVDPSSPFSGGAMLGDRVRMQAHAQDAGVFIRSMATRGHLGGLARATTDAALVLDAAGKDFVVIETVGVGQDEVEIARTADVSVVVLVPGMGDDVQALKAGVMEIADVFVVNKADRDGADRAVAEIESLLGLHAYREGEWRPPIVRTQATTGQGLGELMDHISRFRTNSSKMESRRRDRAAAQLRAILAARLMQQVESRVSAMEMEKLADRIASRGLDPYTAAMRFGARHMKAVLDHVGIAVADLEASLTFFRDALGLHVEPPEDVATERVRAQFISTGPSSLELLQATSPDSPIAKFLAKRGPGLHHITLRVDDIHAALAQLRQRDVRLIDDEPRPGAEGAMVAFIHPSSAEGVLVELKQPARARPTPELPKTIRLGDIDIVTVSDGFFYLDGGAMFGVVPKIFWEQKAPPDERNRIRMAMRCVLLRGARTMLVDAGAGDKMTPKQADIYRFERDFNLQHSLPAAGVSPDAIDVVLATHLHFDHAGGFTERAPDGSIRPRFPRAQYIVRRGEFEDAMSPNERTKGSYFLENYKPLADHHVLQLVDDDASIMPGVRVRRTGGHTMHHQVVTIESAGKTAVFAADLLPTAAHLPEVWVMGYDLFPLDTLNFKRAFLREAIERDT